MKPHSTRLNKRRALIFAAALSAFLIPAAPVYAGWQLTDAKNVVTKEFYKGSSWDWSDKGLKITSYYEGGGDGSPLTFEAVATWAQLPNHVNANQKVSITPKLDGFRYVQHDPKRQGYNMGMTLELHGWPGEDSTNAFRIGELKAGMNATSGKPAVQKDTFSFHMPARPESGRGTYTIQFNLDSGYGAVAHRCRYVWTDGGPAQPDNKPAPAQTPASGKPGEPAKPAPAAPPAPGAPSFAGKWETPWGEVTLRVKGNKIEGSYPHDGGQIIGVLEADGLRVTGTWSEEPTRTAPNDAGDFVWTLAADGKSFTGHFWYGKRKAGVSGAPWNGTKN